MALVVSSAPLAALWAKAEPEKRPAERAPRQHSSSSSSSRRTSSGSSGAETLDSSCTSTQQSGSSSASKPSPKKHKARARHRGADIVLHVQGCAFALHSRVLKRKCGVLYRFIAQLRTKNAVGLLASGDGSDRDDNNDDELEPLPLDGLTSSHLHYGGHLDDDDQDDCAGLFRSRDKQFVLRQCAPLRSSRQATSTNRQARCVLLPRNQLLERASQTSPARLLKFSKVCCVAHKRVEDTSPSSADEPRQRSAEQRQAEREEFSPGKENYASAGLSTSTVRARPVPRVALAPKMPFSSATSSYVPSLRSNTASASMNPNVPSAAAASAGSSPSSSSPRRESPSVAPDAFAVELIGASADAVATFIEFLYTGKTAGIHQGNAATIASLCKWFWMEDHLLHAALVARARNVQSAEQWMDVLLSCRTIRSKPKRNILVNYLLGRLSKLTADQYRNVMEDMPLHRLPAIDDADLLAHIMTSMVNNLRHVKIWHKLTFALELWLFWSFGRRFAAAVPLDHPHPITVRQPMSLLDFHHKFVSWNPVIRIREVNISGIDAYIKPTTLFSFGPFVFQVRLEPNRSPLMNWRVVRAGTPSDLDGESEQCQFLPGMEPTFTLRGQLCIMHRDSPTGPPHQNNIFVRYSHTEVNYGKWHVLLSTSPERESQVDAHPNEPESEEKTQEPDSSQEETAPLEPDSDSELDPRSLAYRRAASPSIAELPRTPPPPPSFDTSGGEISDSSGNSPFEPIASQLSGQVFVWGHRLCNLYHFLLVSTLFYQLPRDAPHELRVEVVQARLRELPVETLVLVLHSDRLRVPEGETALAAAVATLCLSNFGALHYSIEQIRALFRCVRWCFVDLEQIMVTLEHARRELQLYELVEQQLRDHYNFGTTPRRTPWGDDDDATPYRATTTLVEFQIEAGDRSLSPSKFLLSQE